MSVRERIDIKSTGGDSEFYGRRRANKGNRQHGLHLFLDDLFTSAGTTTPQSRGFTIEGDRTEVMGGDAHDILLVLDYTNEAVNTPAGSYARGLSVAVQNEGTAGALQGAMISTKNKSGATLVNQRSLIVDLTHDATGVAATGMQEGIRVNMKIVAIGPTHADTTGNAGITVNNDATGEYANKADAFKVRSIGKQFRYLFDLYDSRVVTSNMIMRFPIADGSGLPAVWFCGTANSDSDIRTVIGSDSLWADGSWYSNISDSAGALWVKINDTWTKTT